MEFGAEGREFANFLGSPEQFIQLVGILHIIPKGQLISKCLCEKIVSTKIPTKKYDRFCPASFIQTRYVNYALTCSERNLQSYKNSCFEIH